MALGRKRRLVLLECRSEEGWEQREDDQVGKGAKRMP